MVTSNTRANNRGQKSVGSKDRAETNKRTNGHDRFYYLPRLGGP